MTENELLAKMVAPGQLRPRKAYRGGVIQVHITRACNLACNNCTQGSELGGKYTFMPPEMFEAAVRSLGFKDGDADRPHNRDGHYFGVVGVFGGNPAMSPHFSAYCEVLRRLVPFTQRGVWSNDPMTVDNAREMARTFDPSVSNINVHLNTEAFERFREGWPAVRPVGLHDDSRHAPVHLAMRDVVKVKCPACDGRGSYIGEDHETSRMNGYSHLTTYSLRCRRCEGTGRVPDDDRIRELVSTCDINQNWSAMVGMFRGELRAFFCEIAGAQAILHQDEPDYPDTGLDPRFCWAVEPLSGALYAYAPGEQVGTVPWWQLPMIAFRDQVRKHCFECGVPLRGYGELSQDAGGVEQTSAAHLSVFKPKRKGRKFEVVADLVQLGTGRVGTVTHYIQNGRA